MSEAAALDAASIDAETAAKVDAEVEARVQAAALAIDAHYVDQLTAEQAIAFLLRLKTHYDNSLAELQAQK